MLKNEKVFSYNSCLAHSLIKERDLVGALLEAGLSQYQIDYEAMYQSSMRYMVIGNAV